MKNKYFFFEIAKTNASAGNYFFQCNRSLFCSESTGLPRELLNTMTIHQCKTMPRPTGSIFDKDALEYSYYDSRTPSQ
ncbi:MAG: hypothetical protein SFU25_07275 [Candidatus Caenarcaniphilales bacterium]|nr:hypothetical protein [Candidatus Caenarcaniphilales bacterium]